MSQLAREIGKTRAGLYKALSENVNPNFTTMMKPMRALGMQLRTGSRSALVLETRALSYCIMPNAFGKSWFRTGFTSGCSSLLLLRFSARPERIVTDM